MAPPKILKDKHVKLRLAAAIAPVSVPDDQNDALTPEAILVTPRCHPDGASITRSDVRAATENRQLTTENWRRNITFDALGWHMAERLQAANLLAGDTLDIAFTIGHNDHPEYGGLELSLRDYQIQRKNGQ
jgi:hypothetical protein